MIRALGGQFLNANHFRCQGIVRQISTSLCVNKTKAEKLAEQKRKDERDKEMRWSKLYLFTNMKYHAIVTRLKIYPFFATIFGSPLAYLLETSQVIPNYTCTPYLAFGISGTVTLSLYSAALAETVGLIYICKENKNLQIGYIDFMGRQNFIETTVDAMKEIEKSPVKYGLYKTFKIHDGKTEKVLKIPWTNREIYDDKLFRRCFGK